MVYFDSLIPKIKFFFRFMQKNCIIRRIFGDRAHFSALAEEFSTPGIYKCQGECLKVVSEVFFHAESVKSGFRILECTQVA